MLPQDVGRVATALQDQADLISQAKRELRVRHLRRRDGLGQDIRSNLASKLASEGPSLCAEFAREGGIAVVSVYARIGSEPDPASLVAALHAQAWPLCLPIDNSPGRPLIYRRWSPEHRLAPGPLGILEPLDIAQAVEPDVMFIPMVAFDQTGNRVGYGAGNVDSTLRHLRSSKRLLVVGVAFAGQEEMTIATSPTDEPVDMIITEAEVIKCRAGYEGV